MIVIHTMQRLPWIIWFIRVFTVTCPAPFGFPRTAFFSGTSLEDTSVSYSTVDGILALLMSDDLRIDRGSEKLSMACVSIAPELQPRNLNQLRANEDPKNKIKVVYDDSHVPPELQNRWARIGALPEVPSSANLVTSQDTSKYNRYV